MIRDDYAVMWDYPSYPLAIYELTDKRKRKIKENETIVRYGYYKMSKKTYKRIEKMIEISNAFAEYLGNKKIYLLVDRERKR